MSNGKFKYAISGLIIGGTIGGAIFTISIGVRSDDLTLHFWLRGTCVALYSALLGAIVGKALDK